ncbi:MAG: hypothetical protein H6Q66_1304 [Firmicutes bacterium]|nr:hypothetical protein [Bacillota bacterium]
MEEYIKISKGGFGKQVFTSRFWFSLDMKEQIIISNGKFILTEHETNNSLTLGETLAEVKARLMALEKESNFPSFMCEKGDFLIKSIYK